MADTPQAPNSLKGLPDEIVMGLRAVVAEASEPSKTKTGGTEPQLVLFIATDKEFDYISDDAAFSQGQQKQEGFRYFFEVPVGPLARRRNIIGEVIVMGGKGEVPACRAVSHYLAERLAGPQLIVNLGISAGISKDAPLGKVVIANLIERYIEDTKVQDVYQFGSERRVLAEGENPPVETLPDGSVRTLEPVDWDFTFRPKATPVDPERGLKIAKFVARDKTATWQGKKFWDAWQEQYAVLAKECLGVGSYQQAERNLKHLCKWGEECLPITGKIASGPFMCDSKLFLREVLRSRLADVLALDMESGGFLEAVLSYEHERRAPVRHLIIRGISDHGDGTKGASDEAKQMEVAPGGIRKLAMRSAFKFLLMSLQSERVDEMLV